MIMPISLWDWIQFVFVGIVLLLLFVGLVWEGWMLVDAVRFDYVKEWNKLIEKEMREGRQ